MLAFTTPADLREQLYAVRASAFAPGNVSGSEPTDEDMLPSGLVRDLAIERSLRVNAGLALLGIATGAIVGAMIVLRCPKPTGGDV